MVSMVVGPWGWASDTGFSRWTDTALGPSQDLLPRSRAGGFLQKSSFFEVLGRSGVQVCCVTCGLVSPVPVLGLGRVVEKVWGSRGAAVPPHTVSPAAPLGQTQLRRRGSHLCAAGSRKWPRLMPGKFVSL